MAKKKQRGFKMFYPGGPLVIPQSAMPSYMAPATNLNQAPTPNIAQPMQGAQAPSIGISNIAGGVQGAVGLYQTMADNLKVPKIQEQDFTSGSKQELLSKATDFKGYEMPKTNAVSSGLSGAASGAAAGTAIAPGIGTAIGAGVGLVGGAVSSIFGNSKRKRAKRRAEKAAMNNINAQNTELTEDSIYSSLSSQLADGGPMKPTEINYQQDIETLPLKMASWIQGAKPLLKRKIPDILKSKPKKSFIGLDAIGNVLDLAADEYEINKSTNPKREREIRENMRKESIGFRDYGLPYTIDPMSKGGKLVEFKNGGSHEENPFGGIPQGYNENGDLNLVEQGETKWNDYIFSDRNKLSKAERFNLPGILNNRTFSSAAKTIQKESEERPLDLISKRGLNKQMDYLMSAQEEHNAISENTNQFKSGGQMNFKSNKRVPGSQGVSMNGNPKTVKHGYGDWLRYAPVASNVISLASDIASTPETIRTSKIEAPLLSEKMSYDPIDQEYLTNKLTSNYSNLIDKIQGSSGGNRGVSNASMIAAMNNLYDAYGDTAIKSKEYNRDMLAKTLEFKRATSQANAQMRMAADQYNANAEDRMIATNAANRAARRNAIREQIAGLGENLGAIGTEQRWMDLAPKLFRGYTSTGDHINQTIKNIVLDNSDSPSPLAVAKSRGLIKEPSQKISQKFIDLAADLQSKANAEKRKKANTSVKAVGGGLYDDPNKKNREAVKAWASDLSRFVTTIPEAIGSLFNGGAPISGSSYGGGSGGGAGAGTRIRKENKMEDWFKNDTIYVPITETFNDAFANARKNGDEKFTFNDKEYTTELGGNSESVKAGESRTRAIGLLPFVKKRRLRLSDENKSFNRKGWTKKK